MVNAEKRLKFGHKALLNQAISFQLGNQKFHATDKWLAGHWGESTQVIKKIIRELKKRGLIFCELIRRKHTEGDKNWYNKRYITVDFKMLEAFLGGADTSIAKSEMKDRTLTDEEAVSFSEMEDSYFGGNYPIEDNEYCRELYGDKTAGQAKDKDLQTGASTTSRSALDYDTFRVIALLSNHESHLRSVTSKFPDFVDCLAESKLSSEHIKVLEQFHTAMLSDEKLRNEYRSIT